MKTRARHLQENGEKSIIGYVKDDGKSLKYGRVLLKLSGEALGGANGCLDGGRLAWTAQRVKELLAAGVQVGIVCGGGNIFRGLSGEGRGVERTTGDTMGMLATVINSLAICDALEREGVEMPKVAELFTRRRALECLAAGSVAIFAGGTGNPYFSTDSAAALRACEIGANALVKATKVDGIYTADPKKDPSAAKFDALDYATALEKRLKVMDAAAFALCMDNSMPIIVLDFFDSGAMLRAVRGEKAGTVVGNSI